MDFTFVQIRHKSLPGSEQKEAIGRVGWKEVKHDRIGNEQHIIKQINNDLFVVIKSEYVGHLGEADQFFSILQLAIHCKDSERPVIISFGTKKLVIKQHLSKRRLCD